MALPLATVVKCETVGAITTGSGGHEHVEFSAVGSDELLVDGAPIKLIITTTGAQQGLFTEGVNYSLTLDAIP